MAKLKKVTLQLIAGANIATLVAMAAVGYSDRLDPAAHPLLCTIGLAMPIFLVINLAFIVFWVIAKPHYVLIPLAGFIVCYQPVRTYFPVNPFRPSTDSTLKVMSFNVWLFASADNPDSTTALANYMKKEHPDILCLQEADLDNISRPIVDSILTPMYAHRDTSSCHGGDFMMVYSRYPILRHENIEYSSLSNHSTAFYLNVKGDTVLVVVNHLQSIGLSPEDKTQFKDLVKQDLDTDSARVVSHKLIDKISMASILRAPQARAVADYVNRHRQYPTIVCGDFNDGPISYSRRTIGKNLTDCYREAGNGLGISYHRGGFYVRIDNIFCNDFFTPVKCIVDNRIKASDHYPIVCWLRKKTTNQ